MVRPAIVGALGTSRRASVSDAGAVTLSEGVLEWWIGADDGWHLPADDMTTRHRRPNAAPIFETAVHIPGGDVVQRVYAVATTGEDAATVVDIENTTRMPCSIAVVLRIAEPDWSVDVDGTTVALLGRQVSTFSLSRPPRVWADGVDDEVQTIVTTGQAHVDPMPSWRSPRDIALLVPGPPRTTFRVVHAAQPVDARQMPTVEVVERGWETQLDRGMRTELPEPWQASIDAARADVLLSPPSAAGFGALEDWGFDTEATAAWSALSMRNRRVARRRVRAEHAWPALREEGADAAVVLQAMRDVLVDDSDKRVVDLLPLFPFEWLGQPVAVHDAPTRLGPVSFAIRWHGARPALLWDAPAGVTVRASALDASWSSTTGAGDTLLQEPPATLLPMGSRQPASGTEVESPESFS